MVKIKCEKSEATRPLAEFLESHGHWRSEVALTRKGVAVAAAGAVQALERQKNVSPACLDRAAP